MSKTLLGPEIFPVCARLREILKEACQSLSRERVGRAWGVRTSWEGAARDASCPLLFVSTLGDVDSNFVRQVRSLAKRPRQFLFIAEGLPYEGIAERLAWLNVRDPGRIHLARAKTHKELFELLRRLLVTLDADDQSERILDAWWEGDTLVVLSPRFQRLHVPLVKLPSLRDNSRGLDVFEIDLDGAYVYWPELDVHLGWEQFAQAIDDKAYLKARQQSIEFNKCYGSAIRSLRQRRGLLQSDINGLTPRQVGRIERGECRATHSALTKLAKAHGINTSDYMAEVAKLVGSQVAAKG